MEATAHNVTKVAGSPRLMSRDERAYLADILESCDAIVVAVLDFDLIGYQGNRLIRSSVEREFIIIGEAIAALAASRRGPSR